MDVHVVVHAAPARAAAHTIVYMYTEYMASAQAGVAVSVPPALALAHRTLRYVFYNDDASC